MANVINTNSSSGSGRGVEVNNATATMLNTKGPNSAGSLTSLRELGTYLQPVNNSLHPDASPYDHIIEMIRGLDLQDDGITMNHKIKSIEMDFCNIVKDENMLCESMDYINDQALGDAETALKFALLFASRNFDALAMKATKVRTAMLTLLQKNFVNSESYRAQNRERLYNSITLLGEYYHRVRLADNSPITILGESLLGLLTREISEDKNVNDVKLAKLILSQITLNGDLMRTRHKTELSQLLYHIRRNLIEQTNLKSTVKAIMLMTLDLFYSNFASLDTDLEEMYTKYFILGDQEDEGNNNNQNTGGSGQQQATSCTQTSPAQTNIYQRSPSYQQQHSSSPSYRHAEDAALPSSNNTSYENGDSGNVNDEDETDPESHKKWSEQVCEDSFEEYNDVPAELGGAGVGGAGDANGYTHEHFSRGVSNNHDPSTYAHNNGGRFENDFDRNNRNPRRLYQQSKQSPRKANKFFNNPHEQNYRGSQNSVNEERDESKPLPRWRAPRFNDQNKDNRSRNPQRRFSASFDDDRQSVRSDGGSIRLYSINDRLKHAQEQIERSGANPAIPYPISNWDRQSQRDDRSERSYMSNYERGNNHHRRGGGGGGGRYYRNTYDKPPRFQKNKANNNNNNSGNNNYSGPNRDKIHSESWRRSNNSINNYPDENASYHSNGPESNSRSSSRARTLPRPAKSSIAGSAKAAAAAAAGAADGIRPTNNSHNSYRRSHSPNSTYHKGGGGGGGGGGAVGNNNKNRSRNFPNSYGSQSSLASEASSSTLDRRHHQRNRSFAKRTLASSNKNWTDDIDENTARELEQQQESQQHWNNKEDNSELVRNARQTADYMNYLSSQK